MTVAPMESTQRARKDHGQCAAGCGEEIREGQAYIRLAWPAWMDYEADVDEEGRPIGWLRPEGERHWQVIKMHYPDCFYNLYYGR